MALQILDYLVGEMVDIHDDVCATVGFQAVNEVYAGQDGYLPQLRANIEKVLLDDNSGHTAEIDAKIETLRKEMLIKANARQDYEELGKELIQLRDEKYRLLLEDAVKKNTRKRMDEFENYMKGLKGKVDEYDESLVRRLIERITVFDDHLMVSFKSGIEIEVRL